MFTGQKENKKEGKILKKKKTKSATRFRVVCNGNGGKKLCWLRLRFVVRTKKKQFGRK